MFHNDLAEPRREVEGRRSNWPKLIACESLYSMDAMSPRLPKICDLAQNRRDHPCRRGRCRRITAGAAAASPSVTASRIASTFSRYAGQGVRLPRGLIAANARSSCRALLRAGLHLHHRAAAGDLLGRDRRDQASEDLELGGERDQDRAARVGAIQTLPACRDVERHPIVPLFIGDAEKRKRRPPCC